MSSRHLSPRFLCVYFCSSPQPPLLKVANPKGGQHILIGLNGSTCFWLLFLIEHVNLKILLDILGLMVNIIMCVCVWGGGGPQLNLCGCYLVFCFMFCNFQQLDLHNKICVALANLEWNICKNWIVNRTSPNLVMLIENACLLIS